MGIIFLLLLLIVSLTSASPLRPGQSDNLKLRPRRLPYKTVCQLGTCLLHNLGNSLHQLSKTEGKEGSKDANDPYGYGR